MEAESRPILALGHYTDAERARLTSIAELAAMQLTVFPTLAEASVWRTANSPHVILARVQDSTAEALGPQARAQQENSLIPIVSLVDNLDDLGFAEVFSWGGDDAVEFTSGSALIPRLRRLPRSLTSVPRATHGAALIASTDQAQRLVLGRVLRQAGYEIRFAVTAEDTINLSTSVDIVVATIELTDEPVELTRQARDAGSRAMWVLLRPPRELAECQHVLDEIGNAVAADGYAPPENVVFLINELSRGAGPDNRASRRLLYGVTVHFRGVGRESDDLGYSFNISEGGLYVRTLAPPDDDEVWLELRPPRSDKLVRLEGKVVWRRGFGANEWATVPPGFGFCLTDGSQSSRQVWRESYCAFGAALGMSPTSLCRR